MFDRTLNLAVSRPLRRLASAMHRLGLHADPITWAGFLIGMTGVPLIASGHERWAILCILLNRLADGLDGAVARLSRPTDRGAFLDITLDFLFYASIPLGFALAEPVRNGLPAALLIYSFVGTGSTFLAFAVLAAQRAMDSAAYPNKGFFYLGGLTESTETIAAFLLMCVMPEWFSVLAYGFAGLCAMTTVSRMAAGIAAFRSDR